MQNDESLQQEVKTRKHLTLNGPKAAQHFLPYDFRSLLCIGHVPETIWFEEVYQMRGPSATLFSLP